MNEPTALPSDQNAAATIAEVRRHFLDRLAIIVAGDGAMSAPSRDAVQRGAGRFFDEIVSQRSPAGFEQAHGLTASKISLVDDNELELGIRLGTLSRHLNDACAIGLAKLFPRLVTLLDRPDLDDTDNPVGPEAVCRGISEFFADQALPAVQAGSQLSAMEAHLARELPLVYAEINQILVNRQVRPARMRTPAEGRQASGIADRHGAADPMSALQQTMLGRQAGGPTATGMGSPPPAVGSPPAGAGAVFNAALMQQLLSLLPRNLDEKVPVAATATGPEDLKTLKAGEFGRLARGQEAATLDTLTVLFEAIFDDRDLPDSVKAVMARLQIPILKAALQDPSCFNDPAHPARTLLDTMARAAEGLDPRTGSDHPVCVELARIANAVQTGFDGDPDVLARLTAELDTFIAHRQHDLQLAAQPFVTLAEAQEASDLAERESARALRAMPLDNAPGAIADFLRHEWKKVLVAAHLEGGEAGESWRNARSTVQDLLWTLKTTSDLDERRRMAALVPTLLQRLRAGLDAVGVSQQARAPFFDTCFALQAAALRGKPPPPELLQPRAEIDAEAEAVRASRQETGDLTLDVLRTNEGGAEPGDLVAGLTTGDWLEFELAPNDRRVGRLAWISPGLGNPLFVNPDWDRAISLSRALLSQQLANGKARVLGAEPLFDRAATKAMTLLAKPQDKAS